MKKKTAWYVAGVLVLGLALLGVSCGGAPAAEPNVREPAATEPVTSAASPPAIPHTLDGRDDCLVCHTEGGLKPYPGNHAGRPSSACQACHQPKQ